MTLGRRTLLRAALGIAISLIAIWILIRSVDIGAALQVLATAQPAWIGLMVVTILLDVAARGARWRALLAPIAPVPYVRALGYTYVGYLANNVLPARLGELYRSHALGEGEDISRPTVLGTVVVERVVDTVIVVGLAALLIIPLAFGEWLFLADLYWRIVVAVAILAAVGTALVPLVNLLLAPRRPRPHPLPAPHASPIAPAAPAASAPATQELLPWPTYVDGATPLPMLPDGSPDWNAYYTGHPSPGAHVFTPLAPAAEPHPASAAPAAAPVDAAPPASAEPTHPPARRGYEGYPPPPPLPPRH